MKKIILFVFFFISCVGAGAQSSDLYVSVFTSYVVSPGFPNITTNVPCFDIKVVNRDSTYHLEYSAGKNSHLPIEFKNIQSGDIVIEVTQLKSYLNTNPFKDTITVYPGINTLFLELDRSGEYVAQASEMAIAAAIAGGAKKEQIEEMEKPHPYSVSKPSAPKVERNNGKRTIKSAIFYKATSLRAGYLDFALEELLKMDGVSRDQDDYIVLSDPKVHWSWKNGALLFWQDSQ